MSAANVIYAHVWGFVKNDEFILSMLTVFAHCPLRLQATRNARNVQTVSSTLCPVVLPPIPHHARHAHPRDLGSVDFFLCWQARIITALTPCSCPLWRNDTYCGRNHPIFEINQGLLWRYSQHVFLKYRQISTRLRSITSQWRGSVVVKALRY